MKNSVLLFILTISTFQLQAQELSEKIPGVFMLGNHQEYYEELSEQYPQTLISACNNDFTKAYDLWLQMQKDMETYAEAIDFNLNGIQLWAHAYWNADGTLDYLAYFTKPTSRNVPEEEVHAFFTSFQRQYVVNVDTEANFSHYAHMHFPTEIQEIKIEETEE